MRSPNRVLITMEREYSPLFINGKEIYIDPIYHELHHRYPVGKVIVVPEKLRHHPIAAIDNNEIFEDESVIEIEVGDEVVLTWGAQDNKISENVFGVWYSDILFKLKNKVPICIGLYSIIKPLRPPGTYSVDINGFQVNVKKQGSFEQVVNAFAKGYGEIISSKEFEGIVHFSPAVAYYVTVENILYACVQNHYIDFGIDKEVYETITILDLFEYKMPDIQSVDENPEREYVEPEKRRKYYL